MRSLVFLLQRFGRVAPLALALLLMLSGVDLAGQHGGATTADCCVAACGSGDPDPESPGTAQDADCGDCGCHLPLALPEQTALPVARGQTIDRQNVAMTVPEGPVPAVEPPPVRA